MVVQKSGALYTLDSVALGSLMSSKTGGARKPLNTVLLRRPLEPSQYTSLAFGERCREAGIVQSMGSAGSAYDNAMCESFFATLKCELINRKRFDVDWNAGYHIPDYIENFYNTRRLHSAIGYNSPTNFEKLNHAA